jgi:hypothetical protein
MMDNSQQLPQHHQPHLRQGMRGMTLHQEMYTFTMTDIGLKQQVPMMVLLEIQGQQGQTEIQV